MVVEFWPLKKKTFILKVAQMHSDHQRTIQCTFKNLVLSSPGPILVHAVTWVSWYGAERGNFFSWMPARYVLQLIYFTKIKNLPLPIIKFRKFIIFLNYWQTFRVNIVWQNIFWSLSVWKAEKATTKKKSLVLEFHKISLRKSSKVHPVGN